MPIVSFFNTFKKNPKSEENPDNPSSTAERVAAGAALTGAAAVAVEAQRNPSKARQYRESFKS